MAGIAKEEEIVGYGIEVGGQPKLAERGRNYAGGKKLLS
jgi:hypothetical protein